MTAPAGAAAFHARYDRHPGDRVQLFAAVAAVLPGSAAVLYPGSFVDVGPSVWFDDVTYVDTDRRAAGFFARSGEVARLVAAKRTAAGAASPTRAPRTPTSSGGPRTAPPAPLRGVDTPRTAVTGFRRFRFMRTVQVGPPAEYNSRARPPGSSRRSR